MQLLLIGYGKMGQALMSGWLTKKPNSSFAIIDPYAEHPPKNTKLYKSIEDLPADFKPNFVVFAIKPQVMHDTIPLYKKFISDECVFLSIAAGKDIKFLENYLNKDARIIRAMPNTPAAIGQGITVATGNKHINQNSQNMALELLEAVGQAVWSDNENIMNAVTAVSGSGPAYVFLLIETMTNAGVNAGLPKDLAEQLARQTVIGSAALAKDSKNVSASTLRENVTSPNGTTAAALDVLMDENNNLQQLMNNAINAAVNRGKSLS